MSGHLIALLVAFAFGVLVALDATDRHGESADCTQPPEKVSPALERRQSDSPFLLTHPLRCEWGSVRNCADFGPCVGKCLSAGMAQK